MLFNSYQFIFVFLPLAWAVFFLLGARSATLGAAWLAAASLYFYGYWSLSALPLLITSIVVNYLFGKAILSPRSSGSALTSKHALLVYALVFNLGLLGFFKYANFLIRTANAFLSPGNVLPAVDVDLPIGISFFTFTQIAYLVDAYRREASERSPVHYGLFVTYFPHLIAGPILHHKQMMPQFALASTYKPNIDSVTLGVLFFSLGLFKKVVIADGLAPYADAVFGAAREGAMPTLSDSWVGALAYTFQLYFDFSGYCDMAIGISKLFNIALPINFNSPYKAASITDFWRRWHMTLSAFLKDYLYIPLGGNRRGKTQRYRNLMITMVLGGLWHGAAWTFALWGGLHGLYLIVNHAWRAVVPQGLAGFLPAWLAKLTGIAITFLAVLLAWIPFRADTAATAGRIYRGLLGMNGISLPASLGSLASSPQYSGFVFEGLLPIAARSGISVPHVLGWLGAAAGIAFFCPNLPEFFSRLEGGRPMSAAQLKVLAIACGVALVVSLGLMQGDSPFLYFQF